MLNKNLNLLGVDSEITEDDNNVGKDSLNDNSTENNTVSSDNIELDRKTNEIYRSHSIMNFIS